jgi:pSer/pThr/pTyr-binding forkhead associated (FHA) protein
MRSRITQQWLAGTLGGFIAWCLVEPVPWLTTDPRPGQADIPPSWPRTIVFGLVIGLAISACIAAAYGSGSRGRRNRYLGLGALMGAIGGALGLALGQTVFQTIQGTAHAMSQNSWLGALGYLGEIVARSLGWAGIGLGLGILQGGINGSTQRSRNGAIGGLIGGFLGGLIFALMQLTVESTMDSQGRTPFFFLTGEMMRGIGLTVTGSAIGLFVGLTERFLRNAWVRVREGRNEGQEFLIEKATSTIGRDELSDIPVFGDMTVAKHHASIVGSRGTFVLQAAAPGVALNGVAVQSAPLTEGDVIQIGTREIEFHQKGAPRPVGLKDIARPAVAPKPFAPEGVCEFCGKRKDALGRCSCSPETAPAPVTASTPTAIGVKLMAVSGPYLGRAFPLDKPEVTLGRGDDRDIRLADDTSVSRRHARLLVSPTGLEMLDEGSSNGTFVNGTRITRSPVRPGDEVRVGDSLFRLEAA